MTILNLFLIKDDMELKKFRIRCIKSHIVANILLFKKGNLYLLEDGLVVCEDGFKRTISFDKTGITPRALQSYLRLVSNKRKNKQWIS